MAAGFIGITVIVKLASAPDQPVQGLVSDVQDKTLFLENVFYPATGQRLHQLAVHGTEILDLEVAKTTPSSTPFQRLQNVPQQTSTHTMQPANNVKATTRHFPALNDTCRPKQHTHLRPAQLPPLPSKQFIDPAIVSYDRTISQPRQTSVQPGNDIISQFISSSLRTNYEPNQQLVEDHQGSRLSVPELSAYATTPASSSHNATDMTMNDMAAPFNALILNDEAAHESVSGTTAVEFREGNAMSRSSTIQAQEIPSAIKRHGRGRRKKGPEQKGSQFEHEDSSPGITRKLHSAAETNTKGWRQTPFARSKHESSHHLPTESGDGQPAKVLKRRQRRQKPSTYHTSQNGWATEDATDVHEMGDFDFEGNLSKFDKHAVFAQLRDENTTADEDRLVSFNRMRKPGTFGGQNLHPSENVLENHSEDSTTESESDEDLWNGSVSSKPAERPSRNSSVRPEALPRASSTLSERAGSGCGDAHSLASSRSQQKHPQQSLLSSHVSGASKSFDRASSGLQQRRSNSCQHRPRLRYVGTDRVCRTVKPDILQQIEQIAISELKYSEDMLSENAGRGIAEVALAALNPGGRRLEENQNPQPIVVMLLGNNEAGARALVSARHLRERGVRVIACTTGPVSLTSEPLSQAWQRFGDMLRGWTETAAYLKTLDAPPELIIDALFGRTMSTLDDLEPGVLEASQVGEPSSVSVVADMVEWANRSSANVLSIDLPSGIDPVTGDVAVRDDGPLVEIRAKVIICLGAPCTGLLKALELRGEDEQQWRVIVADIGLNPAAKQYLRSVKGSGAGGSGKLVQFGTGWSVRLRFDPGRGFNVHGHSSRRVR